MSSVAGGVEVLPLRRSGLGVEDTQGICLLWIFISFFFFLAIKYDAAKEERYQQEAKQKELQRIEEALQISAKRGEASDLLSSWPFVNSPVTDTVIPGCL